MAREDVARTLEGLGINSAEAARRVDGLTAAEAQRMVDRFDQLPAGRDAVGAIVGAALLVFIVLLVTDLLGLTDVFPFVKKTVR